MSKKSLIDMIKEEQQKRKLGSVLNRFVLLREPGSVRIRFLDDLKGSTGDENVAMTYYVHEIGDRSRRRAEPPRRIICLQSFGEKCRLCEAGVDRRMHVAFRVFDYSADVVRLLELRPGSSALDDLINYYEEYGTITDADYVFKRSGMGLETKYSIILKDKGEFKKPKTARKTWIEREEVIDIIKKRYSYDREEG